MASLDPGTALAGGALIGLAVTLFLWLTGRIAGNSGMIHGLIPPQRGQSLWRALYLAGLVLGCWTYAAAFPGAVSHAKEAVSADPILILFGGLLVGYGTRMGGGCTSGHGVCGIGRLSLRSLIATLTFMAAGFLTVFLLRHVMGRAL